MRRRVLEIVALMLLSVALISCAASGGGPQVSDARIGQPTGSNASLYFTARSRGEADRLIAASSETAHSVELHETTVGADGKMGMAAVDGLDLPAGGTLVLEPGGYHMMLVGVAPIAVGDTVEVTITWENAGEMTIQAQVVDPADTVGDSR